MPAGLHSRPRPRRCIADPMRRHAQQAGLQPCAVAIAAPRRRVGAEVLNPRHQRRRRQSARSRGAAAPRARNKRHPQCWRQNHWHQAPSARRCHYPQPLFEQPHHCYHHRHHHCRHRLHRQCCHHWMIRRLNTRHAHALGPLAEHPGRFAQPACTRRRGMSPRMLAWCARGWRDLRSHSRHGLASTA